MPDRHRRSRRGGEPMRDRSGPLGCGTTCTCSNRSLIDTIRRDRPAVSADDVGRHDSYPGVWSGPAPRTLARSRPGRGVRVERGRTMHGVALNVDPDADVLRAHRALRDHRLRRRLPGPQGDRRRIHLAEVVGAFADTAAAGWAARRRATTWATDSMSTAPTWCGGAPASGTRRLGPGPRSARCAGGAGRPPARTPRSTDPARVRARRRRHRGGGTSVRLLGQLARAGVFRPGRN